MASVVGTRNATLSALLQNIEPGLAAGLRGEELSLSVTDNGVLQLDDHFGYCAVIPINPQVVELVAAAREHLVFVGALDRAVRHIVAHASVKVLILIAQTITRVSASIATAVSASVPTVRRTVVVAIPPPAPRRG
jgi:hypothetical protein